MVQNSSLYVQKIWRGGAVGRVSNAYSLRRGRRLPPTSRVEELKAVIVHMYCEEGDKTTPLK
jgi:hypothetical protein